MARFTRFLGCCLASLLGLVFAGPAFATVYPDNSAAYSACASAAGALAQAKCVYKNQTPFGANQGTYACVELKITSPTASIFRYCNGGGTISSCNGAPATQVPCANAYRDYVIPGTSVITGNTFMYFWTSNVCASKPTFNVDFADGATATGSLENVCAQGCRFTGVPSWHGTYPEGALRYTYTTSGSVCSPEDTVFDAPVDPDAEITPEDINTDQDGDGKNDGDDPCPNDPTDTCNIPDDSKDTDGDGKPDYQDPFPNDPTNGKGDGNGNGDGNTSSGGGDCVVPPACGGDPIACNTLFQVWAHRCGKTGGTAGEGPTGGGTGPGGTGDNSDVVGEISGLRDDLAGLASDGGVGTGAGASELSGLLGTRTFSTDDIDASGFGFPRTCPLWQDVSFPVGGTTMTLPLSGFTLHCDIFEWTGYLIVAFASFWSLMLLIRTD